MRNGVTTNKPNPWTNVFASKIRITCFEVAVSPSKMAINAATGPFPYPWLTTEETRLKRRLAERTIFHHLRPRENMKRGCISCIRFETWEIRASQPFHSLSVHYINIPCRHRGNRISSKVQTSRPPLESREICFLRSLFEFLWRFCFTWGEISIQDIDPWHTHGSHHTNSRYQRWLIITHPPSPPPRGIYSIEVDEDLING